MLGHKIILVGSPGAGKSTFARALAERTRLPLHHLDTLYWDTGWQRRYDREDWKKFQESLVAESEWIIDGNYHSTLDLRIAAADTVIFLDVSPVRALWNIAKRIKNYRAGSRTDMADGCPERFDWALVLTVIRYPWRDRRTVMALVKQYDKSLITLQSHEEASKFLDKYKSPE